MIDKKWIFERFPVNDLDGKDKSTENLAIKLYGKRFYKDQTLVEYLAELLLVFASPKKKDMIDSSQVISQGEFQFYIDQSKPVYYPEDRVALKLFSFFPNSKLETRHPAHRQAYMDSLRRLSDKIDGSEDGKKEVIQLLQSLLNGFVGVSSNRTWVTQCFLPASTNLLAREVDWLHTGKSGANSKNLNWIYNDEIRFGLKNIFDDNEVMNYFVYDRHNFMARGGELLFLQLVNLFDNMQSETIKKIFEIPSYCHLKVSIETIKQDVETGLSKLLANNTASLNHVIDFVSSNLHGYNLYPTHATLGWIPAASKTEALLFAVEIRNICLSNLETLEKLELLQTLCCMQVLRTHCFQARRLDDCEFSTDGFLGNYVWIVANDNSDPEDSLRKMAQESFKKIDNILYRVLRHEELPRPSSRSNKDAYSEADKHGYDIFKKLAKDLGLVIPRQGQGARFVLHQGLLRFLVAALIRPGERIRLTHFYERIFAHYGIAIGGDQLKVALQWLGKEAEGDIYAFTSNTTWVEEALKQGGFLVELSDAVSMVMNPGEE